MPKEVEKYKSSSKVARVGISMRMRELLVAKSMMIMPHEWDRLPVESKAEMIAVFELDNKIAGYQQDSLREEK